MQAIMYRFEHKNRGNHLDFLALILQIFFEYGCNFH